MMEILKYLNGLDNIDPLEDLSILKEYIGVKHSWDERFPELYVINYCQIDSPKFNPIVIESRSLVLSFVDGKWSLVSRAFDRFLNHGEIECSFNVAQLTAYEKLDGSLVSVFFYPAYGWLYRTKSMIMPLGVINDTHVKWSDVIEEAVGNGTSTYDTDYTYILEVTSPENRVVTRYTDRSATLLAVRKFDGSYVPFDELDAIIKCNNWNSPEKLQFSSMDACTDHVNNLTGLREGYVLYNRLGEPVCKVKSKAYLAAHSLRGESSLNLRRVVELLDLNELDEYLSIFPEDTEYLAPMVRAYMRVLHEAEVYWALYGYIQDNKLFSEKVKDSPSSYLLFSRKNSGRDFLTSFKGMLRKGRLTLIRSFLDE